MTQAQIDAIVAAAHFDTVIVGLAAIAAVIATVYVARKGIRMMLGALR